MIEFNEKIAGFIDKNVRFAKCRLKFHFKKLSRFTSFMFIVQNNYWQFLRKKSEENLALASGDRRKNQQAVISSSILNSNFFPNFQRFSLNSTFTIILQEKSSTILKYCHGQWKSEICFVPNVVY